MTETPGYGPDHLVRGLTLPRRVGYVLAGLGGLSAALLISTLWVTEPAELPARTQAAFAAMILIGVGWVVVAAVALTRGPLFAIDRVVAAGLAVTCSALLMVGMVVIALTRASGTGAVAAGSLGLTMIAVASVMLVRARTYRAALVVRLRELESRHLHPADSKRWAAPIGPLALALRHRRSPSGARRLTILGVVLGMALLGGITVLVIR
jgi:hypothetical protein